MSTRRSLLVELDLDVAVDQRRDVELGERGVAALLRVEGRDPDEPVDAALGGEQAVGVLALGDEGRRLDPRLLALGRLLHLDLEPAALGPAQVHAQEHLGPVLRVGAAGARADGDDGVAGVVLARRTGAPPRARRAAPRSRRAGPRARRRSRRPRRPSRRARRDRRRRPRARGTSRACAARERARRRSSPPSPGRPRSRALPISPSRLATLRFELSRVKGSPRAASSCSRIAASRVLTASFEGASAMNGG